MESKNVCERSHVRELSMPSAHIRLRTGSLIASPAWAREIEGNEQRTAHSASVLGRRGDIGRLPKIGGGVSYGMMSSTTSNTSVALGGMGGLPNWPNASAD